MILLSYALLQAAEPVPGTSLTISAGTPTEHAAGYSIIVPIRVENTGAEPAPFPDLAARPWLVQFETVSPAGKKAGRATTAPAVDPGTTWSIPPRAGRSVLLEIPSSAGFGEGGWSIGVKVVEPAIDLGTRKISVSAPNPVAGSPIWEPTVATAVGATLPWVHQGKGGIALYLMQWAGGGRFEANYPVTTLERVVEPVLSVARAPDARSRWTYWVDGRNLRRVRLLGTEIGPVQDVSLPYRDAELLGRGVTGSNGVLMAPIWVPSPSGTGGTARLMVLDERGGVVTRLMTELPRRPTVTESAADASGGMLLLLGHADGLDLYRAVPEEPAALPVKGVRVVRTIDWMETVGASFVTLPKSGDRPGGLAISALVTGTAVDGRRWVTRVISDVNGLIFDRAQEVPWSMEVPVEDYLSAGYGSWGVIGRGDSGVWYASNGGAPTKVDAPVRGPMALFGGVATRLRWLSGAKVYAEAQVGPSLGAVETAEAEGTNSGTPER